MPAVLPTRPASTDGGPLKVASKLRGMPASSHVQPAALRAPCPRPHRVRRAKLKRPRCDCSSGLVGHGFHTQRDRDVHSETLTAKNLTRCASPAASGGKRDSSHTSCYAAVLVGCAPHRVYWAAAAIVRWQLVTAETQSLAARLL